MPHLPSRNSLYEQQTIPYPGARRGIIVACFVLLVVWVIVFALNAYRDPSIVCGTNSSINTFTYITIATSAIGLGVYMASPDSQLKVQSWIRRIPMFWNYLIDSGYTPYFDPDYFEIKNGHYVRVRNNMYEMDSVGLPKVDAITPLNSFNMDIYRRYYQTPLDAAKHWQKMSDRVAENLMRKYIVERTRIVLVGHSCMIVKAWSGEHLLIHKSKYEDFINDQRATTQWLALDTRRHKDMALQEKYIDGLYYFVNKLKDSNVIIPLNASSSDPVVTHYDRLLQEMSAMSSSMPGIVDNIREVFHSMILNSSVPQSWRAVTGNHLSLKMATLAENLSAHEIQTKFLTQSQDDSDQTSTVLNSVVSAMVPSAEFTLRATQDTRLTSAKTILDEFAQGSTESLQQALKPILPVVDKDQFPIDLKVLPRYALKLLGPHIAAYRAGYNHLHGIRATVSAMQPVRTQPHVSKALGPLAVALRSGETLDRLRTKELTTNVTKFTQIELAKANAATARLDRSKDNLQKIHTVLIQALSALKVPPPNELLALKKKQDTMRTEIDREALSVAAQKENLERQLADDREIVAQIEQLKPQMQQLQGTVVQQAEQLKLSEERASRTEQELANASEVLAAAIDDRNNKIRQLEQLQVAYSNAQSMSAKDMIQKKTLQVNQAAAESRIAELQNDIQSKTQQLSEERRQIDSLSQNLANQTNALNLATAQLTEKTAQLAQMGESLKRFEEDNKTMAERHLTLMDAIRAEGDTKLKQAVQIKDEQLNAIAQENQAVKRQLEQLEANKQTLDDTLKASQENTKKLQAQMAAEAMIKSTILARRNKIQQEVKDQAYQKLLSEFTMMSDAKAQADQQAIQLAAVNEQIKTQLDAVAQQKASIEADTTTGATEKARLIAEIETDRESLKQRLNVANANKNALERKTADLENSLIQARLQVTEHDKNLQQQLDLVAAKEAQLQAKLNAEARQAADLQEARAEVERLNATMRNNAIQLQAELDQAKMQYQEDITAKIEALDRKRSAFSNLCNSVLNNIERYKTMINIPLTYTGKTTSPKATVDNLIIRLDLDLIKSMNKQLELYMSDKKPTQATPPIKSKALINAVTMMYPTIASADGVMLKDTSSKLLSFMYNMFLAISNHQGIIMALNSMSSCLSGKKGSIEKYQILNECRSFIENATNLFDSDSGRVVELASSAPIMAKIINQSQRGPVDTVYAELQKYQYRVDAAPMTQDYTPEPTPREMTQYGNPAEQAAVLTPAVPRRDKSNRSSPRDTGVMQQASALMPAPQNRSPSMTTEYESATRKALDSATKEIHDLGDGVTMEVITPPAY